ncbi:MAG: STAS domain-containing protein [Spirochaetes bacterium]|nr:STAS domain-containing protein [Spirochaetota bacterium]
MPQIILKEDISITNVRKLHAQLAEAIEIDGEDVIVDFTNVKRTDLSVYQVLIAFARECRRRRRILKIKGANPKVKEQLLLCGMIRPR